VRIDLVSGVNEIRGLGASLQRTRGFADSRSRTERNSLPGAASAYSHIASSGSGPVGQRLPIAPRSRTAGSTVCPTAESMAAALMIVVAAMWCSPIPVLYEADSRLLVRWRASSPGVQRVSSDRIIGEPSAHVLAPAICYARRVSGGCQPFVNARFTVGTWISA